jgi:hypothetical protein
VVAVADRVAERTEALPRGTDRAPDTVTAGRDAPDSPDSPDSPASPDSSSSPDSPDSPDSPSSPDVPDSSDSPASSALTDPERRACEHRLHRLLVDRIYGVASDAWAHASPDLRAAWENHKQRYPERMRSAPRTAPDGTWLAGENRRLSPEQNTETAKACADIADEGRRDILPALKRVESAEAGRHLAGLKHMLKGEDRLKEKVADELAAKADGSVPQALDTVADPVRFTFTYRPQRYADGVRADVEGLKAEGFELIKLKNLWTDEQYKGINSQWRRLETGLRFEVQFHTPESLEAKELTHEAYERIRGAASLAERRELMGFQSRVNVYLVTPERTAEIKDYPEKKNG